VKASTFGNENPETIPLVILVRGGSDRSGYGDVRKTSVKMDIFRDENRVERP